MTKPAFEIGLKAIFAEEPAIKDLVPSHPWVKEGSDFVIPFETFAEVCWKSLGFCDLKLLIWWFLSPIAVQWFDGPEGLSLHKRNRPIAKKVARRFAAYSTAKAPLASFPDELKYLPPTVRSSAKTKFSAAAQTSLDGGKAVGLLLQTAKEQGLLSNLGLHANWYER
jgi:hypothetical protein